MKSEKKFQTKEQLLHRIQEGISFGDGEEYSASSYVQMAVKQTQQYFSENVKDEHGNPSMTATLEYLEKCYWDIVEISHEEYTVEYGNDVDSHEFGSGFPRSERGRGIQNAFALDQGCHVSSNDETLKKRTEPNFGTEEFYKESYWNLNNIPNCPGSILQYIKVGINGINVPWMYFGNLFSTFCWHNEDNYLYSINYHHWGAPKLWYGVPGTEKDASGLEQVFKSYLSMKMRDDPDLLHHITTMFSPRLLQIAEVPVYKLIQYPGEFVVTFPMSFHGGFSLGPNVGEAVNFATNE
jgi:JmjC domain.